MLGNLMHILFLAHDIISAYFSIVEQIQFQTFSNFSVIQKVVFDPERVKRSIGSIVLMILSRGQKQPFELLKNY